MTLRRIRARLDAIEHTHELLRSVEGGTVMAMLEAIAAGVPCDVTYVAGAALTDDLTLAYFRQLSGEDAHA